MSTSGSLGSPWFSGCRSEKHDWRTGFALGRCGISGMCKRPTDCRFSPNSLVGNLEILSFLFDHILRQFFQRNQQLFLDGITDPLCSILNRRGFFNRMTPLLHVNPDSWLLFLILDLDRFKAVNDCYGHLTGDQCPAAGGPGVGAPDSRHGSDRALWRRRIHRLLFVNAPDEAAGIQDRLLATVDEAGRVEHLALSASIGAAVGRFATCSDLDSWIAGADAQLYLAKDAGRHGWRLAAMP